jgi:hypothetical protein
MISNMKTNEAAKQDVKESTYALIERSGDKKSALFETVLYGLIAVGAVVAILQFVDQPVSINV